MEVAGEVLKWVIVGLFIIVVGYGLVRGASWAYFRTKLEYLRAAMKEMRKGEK